MAAEEETLLRETVIATESDDETRFIVRVDGHRPNRDTDIRLKLFANGFRNRNQLVESLRTRNSFAVGGRGDAYGSPQNTSPCRNLRDPGGYMTMHSKIKNRNGLFGICQLLHQDLLQRFFIETKYEITQTLPDRILCWGDLPFALFGRIASCNDS